jgi:hypothetical protein
MNLLWGSAIVAFGVLGILQRKKNQALNLAFLGPLKDVWPLSLMYRYVGSWVSLAVQWILGVLFVLVGLIVFASGIVQCIGQ